MKQTPITTGAVTSGRYREDSDPATISGEVVQVVEPEQHSDYMTPSHLLDEDHDAMIVVRTESLTCWQRVALSIPLLDVFMPPFGEPVAMAVDASMAPDEGDEVVVEVVEDVVETERRAGIVVGRTVELLRAVDVEAVDGRESS